MSTDTPEGKITRLLDAWQNGDASAAEELFPLIYDELRVLARRQMARGSSATLQTTAIVHEAYMRFERRSNLRFADRGHFYAVASKAMRQILVDHARRRAAHKRGGDLVRVDLDENRIPVEERSDEILAVDQALGRLEQLDSRLVQIVELRFFGGLSVEETAEATDRSASTVKRDWMRARALLHRELSAASG